MIQLWAVKIMQLLYEIMIVVKNFCGVCFLNDKQGVPDLSGFGDDVYQLGFGLGADQPPTSAIVKQELQRKIIYQMSPQEVINFATIVDTAHPLATYSTVLCYRPIASFSFNAFLGVYYCSQCPTCHLDDSWIMEQTFLICFTNIHDWKVRFAPHWFVDIWHSWWTRATQTLRGHGNTLDSSIRKIIE